MRSSLAIAGLALAFLPHLSGQTPRQFEVASIKINRSGNTASGENTSRGTLTVTNDSLRELLKVAWGIEDFQISGGPRWLDSDRFDIVAKTNAPEDISDNELRPLLQLLLAERFQLVIHRAKRSVTGYALVTAKTGPRLVEHTGPSGSSSERNAGRLRASRATMTTLAASLMRITGRPVNDHTGLKGEYDYKLEWAPTEDTGATLPSIFSALQEQLGLRLESAKVDVEVMVIDKAEQPSEN